MVKVYKSKSVLSKTEEFYLQLARGQIDGHTVVHKFGHDPIVATTSYTPVCFGAVYRTPQPSGATTVRVKAGGNAADTAAGAGAQELTIIGLDATGAEVTDTLATAGASASASTTVSFIRIYRVYVSASGSYADATTPSHVAAIVIENTAGTEDWLTISATGFPRGRSEIGVYSVPFGYTAYITSLTIHVDAAQAAGILMFKRENILETAAPYTSMQLVLELGGAISGDHTHNIEVPMQMNELTDFGFMAKSIASTADVSVNFEILLIKNNE